MKNSDHAVALRDSFLCLTPADANTAAATNTDLKQPPKILEEQPKAFKSRREAQMLTINKQIQKGNPICSSKSEKNDKGNHGRARDTQEI